MKKNKRYVRICAALLCAVLCLSVNVAPAMAAKVTGGYRRPEGERRQLG